MNKIKQALAAAATTALLVSNSVMPALAVEPFDVTGAYIIDFTCVTGCAGTFPHDANFVQTGSSVDGGGGFPTSGPPYDFEWDVITGTVVGNSISLTANYIVGSPGTVMHMTGTIAPDGSMSGNWDDNASGTRTGTWSTTSGTAVVNVPAECDQTASYNVIEGTNGSEVLNGTEGNDLILARGGSDVVNGKGGNDCIVGAGGSDVLRGNAGNDVILGGGESDSITGGADNDKLYGEAANDSLNGEGGDDDIFGGVGSDSLRGGDNNDDLFGEGGSDSLNGNAGTDTANGGANSDACTAETETACEA